MSKNRCSGGQIRYQKSIKNLGGKKKLKVRSKRDGLGLCPFLGNLVLVQKTRRGGVGEGYGSIFRYDQRDKSRGLHASTHKGSADLF